MGLKKLAQITKQHYLLYTRKSMTSKVNYSSIFDTALPNVYIKKVTLDVASLSETQGSAYFDDSVDYEYETNAYGRQVPRLRPINFTEAAATGHRLVAKVELVVKDYRKKNRRKAKGVRSRKTYTDATWVNDEEFLNFAKLRVIVSNKDTATETLRDRGVTEENLKQLKLINSIQERVLSLRKKNSMSLNDFKEQTTPGGKIYSVRYEVPFYLRSLDPQHLAVFAHTYIDLNEYALYQGAFVESGRRFLQGNVFGNLVIDNGQVPANTFYYRLPDGSTWAGPVHQHTTEQGEDIVMAGAFHTARSHPVLSTVSVPNMVVNDERVFELATMAKPLLEPSRKARAKRIERKSQHELNIATKAAYVSEPSYSYDEENSVYMSFIVNYKKMLEDFTQFGKVVDKLEPDALGRLYELSPVSLVQIYRNRVVPGLRKDESKLVDYGDRTELVAETYDSNLGDLIENQLVRPKVEYNVETEPAVVGSIREVDANQKRLTGIRVFAVSDIEMSNKTDGFFSHSVRMEVVDGTIKFAQEQYRKLLQAKNSLIEYYGQAGNVKYYDQDSGDFTEEFQALIDAEYGIPSFETALGENREQRAQTLRQSIGELPWNVAVATYIDTLTTLTDFDNTKASTLSKNMYSMISPIRGNIRGVEQVISLLENLESKLSVSLSNDGQVLVDEVDYRDRTRAYKGKLPKDKFTFEKLFKTKHNSNVQKRVGYDFMNTIGAERTTTGHRVFTIAQIEERFNEENEKYFSNVAVGTSTTPAPGTVQELDLLDTYYSYLTPYRAKLSKGTILDIKRRGVASDDLARYNDLTFKRIAQGDTEDGTNIDPTPSAPPYEPSYSFPGSPSERPGFTFSLPNLSFETVSSNSAIEDSVLDLSMANEFKNNFDAPENKYLSSNSGFTAEPDVDKEENPFESSTSAQGVAADVVSSIASGIVATTGGLYGEARRIPILSLVMLSESERVRRLPNQIKSLYYAEEPGVAINWAEIARETGADIMNSPEYASYFYLNYGHINRVDVLVGFEQNSEGDYQISSPIFAPLTGRALRRAASSGRELFCRMTSYNNPDLKISKNKKLKMREFDAYFHIVSENAPTTVVEQQQEATAQEASEAQSEVIEASSQQASLAVRLTENVGLLSYGKNSLNTETARLIISEFELPEYATSMIVQQPNIVSRVGTNFGGDSEVTPRLATNITAVQAQAASGIAPRTEQASQEQNIASQREDNRNVATSRTFRPSLSSRVGDGGSGY